MKEYPRLFNDDMVRAILDGRKLQTRRPVSPRNSLFDGGPWPRRIKYDDLDWDNAVLDSGPSPAGNPGPYWHVFFPKENTTHRIYPRIQPGDRLWVRETWQAFQVNKDITISKIKPQPWICALGYRATEDERVNDGYSVYTGKWRPSIHMPRWASRITLDVLRVRSQRVQDISHDDAFVEGAPSDPRPNNRGTGSLYIDWFAGLWDSIYADRGCSYESNVPVWIYDFKIKENNHAY